MAVDATSGATPSVAEPAGIPPVSLFDWGRGPFARGSDAELPMAWRAPTRARQRQSPIRPFPPRVCELCRSSRAFTTRSSYNKHLEKAHAETGAFFSASQDRLVFRDKPKGQARPQGSQAGREGVQPRPVLTTPTVRPMASQSAVATAFQEAAAWLQGQAAARLRLMVPAISTGITPPSQGIVPPRGRGRGLLALPATTPTRPWALPTATHPDPQGGTSTVHSISPPRRGPPSTMEQLASVVSELEAQLRGAPGRLVTTLPQPQQSMPDRPAGLSDRAIAPSEPAATSKPALLPGNIAEATRPFWQGVPGNDHQVIPVLLSSYTTDMSAADIQSALDWMRYQRADMARYLSDLISRWWHHNYSTEATLKMLVDKLSNMQR